MADKEKPVTPAIKGAFDKIFMYDGGQFTPTFARLCELDLGMNYEGARRHHELLSRNHERLMELFPDGYKYWGKWEKAELQGSGYDNPEQFAYDETCIDGDGKRIPGSVALFKRNEKKDIPVTSTGNPGKTHH